MNEPNIENKTTSLRDIVLQLTESTARSDARSTLALALVLEGDRQGHPPRGDIQKAIAKIVPGDSLAEDTLRKEAINLYDQLFPFRHA